MPETLESVTDRNLDELLSANDSKEKAGAPWEDFNIFIQDNKTLFEIIKHKLGLPNKPNLKLLSDGIRVLFRIIQLSKDKVPEFFFRIRMMDKVVFYISNPETPHSSLFKLDTDADSDLICEYFAIYWEKNKNDDLHSVKKRIIDEITVKHVDWMFNDVKPYILDLNKRKKLFDFSEWKMRLVHDQRILQIIQ
jgi:hypothetical protein